MFRRRTSCRSASLLQSAEKDTRGGGKMSPKPGKGGAARQVCSGLREFTYQAMSFGELMAGKELGRIGVIMGAPRRRQVSREFDWS
jgi:hypothetical protein